MQLAAGYQMAQCEDGHLHIILLDEDGEPFTCLVLMDTDEIAQFVKDLSKMIKPQGH